jgi:hypothetical protein
VRVAFAALICAAACARDPAVALDRIYGLVEIPDVHLTLGEAARDALTARPREWAPAQLAWGGRTLDGVGVRLKGHRSFRPLDAKPSIKIRVDKYEKGQRLFGRRHFTLNNLVEDPTMVREFLGYRLMRKLGVPAPRVGYVRLVVDGEPYGLYALVETPDSEFLAKNLGDGSGPLYEGEYGCDLRDEDVGGFDEDNGSDESRVRLRELARAAAGPIEPLLYGERPLVDRDSFLSYLAVSAVIGDFDGYRHSHNYRIYFDPARARWYFLPWGIDRAFKKRSPIYDSDGVLAARCFADHRCRLDYLRRLEAVLDSAETLQLDQGLVVAWSWIESAALADPRRPWAEGEMSKARQELLAFIRERPAEIRRQIACLDESGGERDLDGDGFGCMDCDDTRAAIHPGAAEACDGADNDCSGLVDDAPDCPCARESIGGVSVELCELPMSWTEAAEFCRRKGLSLARIDSREQSAALYALAKARRAERWWIGLSDRDVEGRFQWADGTAAAVDGWDEGEPDNEGCNQDCAVLGDDSRGRWHDTHCGQPRPFICRAP